MADVLVEDDVATAMRDGTVLRTDVYRPVGDERWPVMLARLPYGRYDPVRWAAELPGSNGNVGMFGGSYFGNVQWMAALSKPPELTAIAPCR